MFGLLKYRFLQICRMKEIIFWTFFFPLILGTFFKVALAEMMKAEQFQIIQTAVVIEQEDEMTEVFEDFLAELDGDVLAVEKVDADEAEMLLEEGKVRGIYYADEKITLTVAKKGISETVLQSILDSYLQNVEVFAKIAEEHPEQLGAAMESMQDYKEMTELVSLDGRTTDAVVMFFLALIGMACTYGSFLGLQAALDARADQTPLAVRRSVTPLHKGKVIFLDFVVAVTIHFCSVLVLLAYIHFGMKISLGEDVLRMLPVCLAGVVEGVAFGVIIGCLRKISEPAKIGINIGINMFFSFCAGLMDNQTKILIDNNVPLLNKINPVALITDAFYCIAVYDSPAKYQQNILMLTGIAAVLLVAAFLMIRREVYDSI